MGDNSMMLKLEELVNKKNYTNDGKRIIRYSDDIHSNDIMLVKLLDDAGKCALYDEYKYTYKDGHGSYELLSSMEIYKDQYGNMHLVDPDVFIPNCQYSCWSISGNLPSIGQIGGVYIVRNSLYETKEEMEEVLIQRAECEHLYSNHMSSVFESHGMCHCALCGKSWNHTAFQRYAKDLLIGSDSTRYMRYDITVIRKGSKDYVTARADNVFSYGYDGPKSHLIASNRHYITASNLALAARAFYELGYFDYEESAHIYVMYGEHDDFIRGVSAEYHASKIGKLINKVFKRIPKIMYVRSKMKGFDILESTKDELLNEYASKIEKQSKKKRKSLDYDGLEKYVEMANSDSSTISNKKVSIGDLLLGKEIW